VARRTTIVAEGCDDRRLGGESKQGRTVCLRLKILMDIAGTAHASKTERVTVISGTFNIGMGDKFDEKKTRPMPLERSAIGPPE